MKGELASLHKIVRILESVRLNFFILADCYTSDSVRRESELDSDSLRKEVKATLAKYQLL
ncbi:colicin immunity domain-containing protein [Klebsiella variicola subsp. variicola]|nr:colicin immunity domain-containing protein [Klebsiella variicola subsp. variicola]